MLFPGGEGVPTHFQNSALPQHFCSNNVLRVHFPGPPPPPQQQCAQSALSQSTPPPSNNVLRVHFPRPPPPSCEQNDRNTENTTFAILRMRAVTRRQFESLCLMVDKVLMYVHFLLPKYFSDQQSLEGSGPRWPNCVKCHCALNLHLMEFLY